jgi:alanine-alpha-ketoisovalerate/valine-pyruvate aminotransferase
MPMAFAAHAGALLVLMGSPVNVLVADESSRNGGERFGFFSFALVGLPLTLGVIVLALWLGPRLLPERRPQAISVDLSDHARTLMAEYSVDRDVLARHEVPLIEDDVYGDIHFGSERPRPFSALDGSGNTLYCGSFSKTLAPGYRVGWIATGRHMARVLESKFSSTLCGPVLPQLALAEYLDSGGYDHHLRRMRQTFADTLRRMSHLIEQVFPTGTKVSQPEGGFVLWLELPKAVDSRRLFAQALEKNICFAPGVVFSASGKYANCLRLSGGYGWDARIEKGVRTLGAMARTHLTRNAS